VLIYFETHSTSEDNEIGCASGHYDVDLSPLGETQALDLRARYPELGSVYCSDSKRSWRTAELASQAPGVISFRMQGFVNATMVTSP